ncbi:hypothetical protein FAM09_10575 [Niastella caeni]|uniref:Protein phosphatase 2C domain-containing protein n=1 Tax=Niastella caeni TaxID=2569763 RepID=A0A4S8HX61_9BACT|nr:hypothetical protein [Niastella caeni]THU40303.1 hypothetical protein FAM09_10575 [Niastella caeni]
MFERFFIGLLALFTLFGSQVVAQQTDTAHEPGDIPDQIILAPNEWAIDTGEAITQHTKARNAKAVRTKARQADTLLPTMISFGFTPHLRSPSKEEIELEQKQKVLEQKVHQLQTNENWLWMWLRITAVIILVMLVVLIILQQKINKMADNKAMREQIIESYTEGVNGLDALLVQRGFLNMQNLNVNDIEVRNKMKIIKERITELIDKYLNEDASNKAKDAERDASDVQRIADREKLREVLVENHKLAEKLQHYENSGHLSSPIQFVPYTTWPDPQTHIKTEIMLSAGPRKDAGNADTELGEDVAGVLSLPRQTFFWLMDGTSDCASISEGVTPHEESHLFSSRLLAQSIGQYVQRHIAKCFNDQITLNTLLMQARDYVKQEWTQRINSLPADKKQAIKQPIISGLNPLCSTTVIIGRLLDNGNLHVLRSGDSKVFPFVQRNGAGTMLKNDFRFTGDPTFDYDRIAFRLDYNEAADAFQIKCNEMKWAIETAEDVDVVFVFTDGIGRVVEAQLSSNNPGIVEAIKQNISRVPQKTYDDKTLIVLERIINS